MKKIIIICHEPLTKRIKSNFYIDDLIQEGFVVEYWDVSQYIFPGMKLTDQVEESYIVRLVDLSQIDAQLRKTDIAEVVFIVEVRNNWMARHLYKLLSDCNAYMVRIDMYGNTMLNIPLIRKIKNVQLVRAFDILNNRMQVELVKAYRSFCKVKDFDLLFSSSILFSNRIAINHPDYERYILEPNAAENGYIVFLDVYYPLHPDLLYMLKKKGISPLEYQQSLRSFFDALEKKYGKPIVIAAHPKSKYRGDEFGERKILKGKTTHLVKDADLVLLHTSNSVSYAVLYDKPIVLISNSEYNKVNYLVAAQKKLSAALNIPIFDIDKMDIATFQDRKLDKQTRDHYIYSYLTSKETEGLQNREIVLNVLSNL